MNKEELLKGGLDDVYRKSYYDLKARIDKTLEYIENVKILNEEDRYTNMKWEYDVFFPKLLNILKGEDNE